jgi:nanoRNase/pAp phosphatase (c-di-AMP/oligoRNAs hydrolase)
LINFLSMMDAKVAAIFVDNRMGAPKSAGDALGFDVSKIALQFGGGHAAAAG